jgi:hypothetical protein
MFVNPGGPGSSGVNIVEALADDLDSWVPVGSTW